MTIDTEQVEQIAAILIRQGWQPEIAKQEALRRVMSNPASK